MCGGGGGGIGNFIAPILGIVASIAMPYLAPALLPLEAGLIGAGIGAGTNLLGDAITGRPVDPLGLAASTVLGGAGGYLGGGGFGQISDALGLGSSGTIAMAPGVAEGVTAAETASPFAAGTAAGPIAGSAGQTAAGAAAGIDPIGIGATTQTSVSPTDLTASARGAMQAPTSNILSTLGKGYEAAKPALSLASLANAALGGGGGGQQTMASAPSMAAPSMGTRYTTGQAGPYGPGGLGTVWRPDLNAYSTSYAPGQQSSGGFSTTANTLLGQDNTMMG